MNTTQQHFFCTVNIVLCINIKLMLQKILTSFCYKITTLFRDTEVQNLHFNVQVHLGGRLHTPFNV